MSTKIFEDLYVSYLEARKNKSKKGEVMMFEVDLEKNLYELYEDLLNKTYVPNPSKVFIVENPVKREIFAAQFKDRVVHHLLVNYIREIFEKRMIDDSYSCREGKGTLYGIKRVESFLRKCSENYTKECFILKVDIEGFFMNIHRGILLNIVWEGIEKHKKEIREYVDVEWLKWLAQVIIQNDPTKNCIYRSSKDKWVDLPPHKSLFFSTPQCGLPIGNLTSQLFANIYLNEMDWFIKKQLKIKYYGRYVDDMVLIHSDKEYLLHCKQKIEKYLKEQRQLKLHRKKFYLQSYEKGVLFLGAYIKPYRIYAGNRIKTNFYQKIRQWNITPLDKLNPSTIQSQFYSYLGMIKHFNTFSLQRKAIQKIHPIIMNYALAN